MPAYIERRYPDKVTVWREKLENSGPFPPAEALPLRIVPLPALVDSCVRTTIVKRLPLVTQTTHGIGVSEFDDSQHGVPCSEGFQH